MVGNDTELLLCLLLLVAVSSAVPTTIHHASSTATVPHPTASVHPSTTKHHHHGHHTHAPREPSESGKYEFYYDAYSHLMALRVSHGHAYTCYIYFLEGDERTKVHQHYGLLEIESKLLQLSLTKTDPFPYDDINLKHDLHGHFNTFCAKNMKLVKLN